MLNYLLIAIAIIIPGGIPVYFLWRAMERRKKTTNIDYEEIPDMYDHTEYNEIKIAAQKIKATQAGVGEDSAYLQALLAVMVKKYGVVRLNETDFDNVTSDDYISLYIDLKTNDIVLKASSADIASVFGANTSDDDIIYH
jgi:hypothetical protein